MNDIIEINDMACISIEQGDFHTALDVLNRCLACVKRLNQRRTGCIDKDDDIVVDEKYCPFRKQKKEKDERSEKGGRRQQRPRQKQQHQSISDVLKAAKRKLLLSASVRRRLSLTEKQTTRKPKRNATTDTTITNNTTNSAAAADASGMELRPRKRQRRFYSLEAHQQQLGDVTFSKNKETTKKGPFADDFFEVNEDKEGNEERSYFLYRTPLRLTQTQLSMIDECRQLCSRDNGKENKNEERDDEEQKIIEREIELAVSSNLIFNIALSHHLIAMANDDGDGDQTARMLSSFNDNDSNGSDKDTLFKNNKNNSNESSSLSFTRTANNDDHTVATNYAVSSLCRCQNHNEQRLKRALRLYELGFRVHAKRAAAIGVGSTGRQRRGQGVRREAVRRREDEELRSATRYALALINNCSQIHNQLGNSDRADAFRNRLLSFLLMMVDGGERVTDIVTDESTLDGYWKNAFSFGNVFHYEAAPASAA